jgi:ATP-binding protein involved in chromosome partitioning
VAGVIENMSSFECDHGEHYALFGTGGGQALADEIGEELLGQVPIEPTVAAGGDTGEPVVLTGTGTAATVFSTIARRIIDETPSNDDMAGCSARDDEAVVGVTVRRSRDPLA